MEADPVDPQPADKWDCKTLKSKEKAWSEQNGKERAMTVATWTVKFILLPVLIYMFIISLSLMGSAFKILGGKSAGATFRNNSVFDNPIAGLMMGILCTVLVQSSSTSTSIIITMTAAGLLTIKHAIPMIMGANIGTAVTNTIVSITQVGDRDTYRRAFAGATVHDCFNILTVSVLLPIEIITGVLRHIAAAIVDATIGANQEKKDKVDFLKKITKPVTSRLVQVDKKLVTKVAQETDPVKLEELMQKSMIVNGRTKATHMFMDTPMSDDECGWLLLFVSLFFLSTCLILLVKLLQSIFRGRVAIWMQFFLNLDFKRVPCIGDYILLAFGIGITILMQSSSITTSTLTPLVGVGLIKLDKMFPFTVGANIGTTVTGILAALASSNIQVGMQVALAHLFFNLFGSLIWFPIPFMRQVPLGMARFLGSLASEWRWFPIVFIIVVYGVIPAIFFLLSLAGTAVIASVGTILALAILSVLILLCLRSKCSQRLPEILKIDPAWLPNTLRANPAEDDEALDSQQGDADVGGDGWWQGNIASGLLCFTTLLLLMAVPNAQWGNLRYPTFDPREHVGMGAWAVCSTHYEDPMTWGAPPTCTAAQASLCWSWKMGSCATSPADFANIPGANELYEESWNNCTAEFQCTPTQWETACLAGACGGSLHQQQCTNLTEAVTIDATIAYSSSPGTTAWDAGAACRPIGDVCDKMASPVGAAGVFATMGLLAAVVAGGSLSVHGFLGKNPRAVIPIAVSAGLLVLSWLCVLISWAIFAGKLDSPTTCTIVDVTTRKAVTATGSFRDILDNGGGLCFGFIVAAWVLLTFTAPLVMWRTIQEVRGKTEGTDPKPQTEI